MSKITNDGLIRSGTGYFIAVPTVGVKGLIQWSAVISCSLSCLRAIALWIFSPANCHICSCACQSNRVTFCITLSVNGS